MFVAILHTVERTDPGRLKMMNSSSSVCNLGCNAPFVANVRCQANVKGRMRRWNMTLMHSSPQHKGSFIREHRAYRW
jgi:hypothetical protein